ncbi:hypothetical protein [Lacinutrix sp.]|uniref:hypothetical protein n=1 Tax=Lacinutrix sp. TaxID=1937692 RepID=UPI0025C299BC|nr:hypothetical protein [Lacinutrix sp.]
MKTIKKRKEVLLDEEVIRLLEFKAKKAGRTLKNYMEFVLHKKADEITSENEDKTIEIKKALLESRIQSKKGLVKEHSQVINAAKNRVNGNTVDKAS